jgi:hypothetical protein
LARRAGVAIAALAFVGATAWQVIAERDDWPLSAFEMYSNRQGPKASRSYVRGVSDTGEFELADGMLPVGGARLRHLNARLARAKGRQRDFAARIQSRYEARREESGWPVLQAVRAYTETWKIRAGLKGIDAPKRRMTGTVYFPPRSLAERAESERAGNASPAKPRATADADRVVDLDAQACVAGCEAFDDPLAASGRALRLSARGGKDGDPATLTVSLPLPAGTWSLLVRMRTPTRGGSDRLSVRVDGELVTGKSGLGNYERALGTGAFIWASSAPGERALAFDVEGASPHTIELESSRRRVEVDQLWLAHGRRELPTWNEPLAP